MLRSARALSAVLAATALLAGGAHAAPLPGGSLLAFGDNKDRQLGATTGEPNVYGGITTPEGVPLPAGVPGFAQVALGTAHAIGLTTDGRVFTWGNDGYGQLGRNVTSTYQAPPGEVAFPGATGTPAKVYASGNDSAVLMSSGQLYVFGADGNGQLGPLATDYTTPRQLAAPAGSTGSIADIAMGSGGYLLMITTTGELYGQGADYYGQIGRPVPADSHQPNPALQRITAGDIGTARIVGIAAGPSFSLALSDAGTVYGFGYNQSGQLGVSDNYNTPSTNPGNPTPKAVPFPPPVILEPTADRSARHAKVTIPPIFTRRASAIFVADDASFALIGGRIWSWGGNYYGELGRSTATSSTYSPDVVTLPGTDSAVTDVEGTGLSAVAFTAAREVYTWGVNQAGQLGNPAFGVGGTGTPTPAFLPPGTTIAALAGSSSMTYKNGSVLAIVSDLAIATTALPAAHRGEAYRTRVATSDGVAPVRLTAGTLPAGLQFDAATGTISGTPTTEGTTDVPFTATDRAGITASRTLRLTVAPPTPPPPAPTGRTTSGSGSAPTTGTGITTTPPKPGTPRIAKLAYAHGKVTLTITCPTGLGACTGKATLTRSVTIRRKHSRKTTTKLITLAGSKSYTIPPGRSLTLTLRLSRTTLSALRKAHRLAATVSLSGGPRVVSQKLTLASAPSRKHR